MGAQKIEDPEVRIARESSSDLHAPCESAERTNTKSVSLDLRRYRTSIGMSSIDDSEVPDANPFDEAKYNAEEMEIIDNTTKTKDQPKDIIAIGRALRNSDSSSSVALSINKFDAGEFAGNRTMRTMEDLCKHSTHASSLA